MAGKPLRAKQIVSDLEALAEETAFMYAYIGGDEAIRHERNIKVVKFFWDTYAHNQRRRWEMQRERRLPFDPTKVFKP